MLCLNISSDGLTLLQSRGLESRYFDITSKRKRDLFYGSSGFRLAHQRSDRTK